MAELAKAHGAYQAGDTGEWFVDGEVPGALISFIVQTGRVRDYAAETVPQCRLCGCQMVARHNRTTGDPYWSCSSPRCPGTQRFDDALSARRQRDYATPGKAEPVVFEDKQRAAMLVARAIASFRSEGAAMRWLKDRKVALRGSGETPWEAIKTLAGCALVERLLDERFE